MCVLIQEGFSEDLVLLSYLTKRNLIWSESIVDAKVKLEKLKVESSFRWIDWKNKKHGVIVYSPSIKN